MSVVKINAIEVPEVGGDTLERLEQVLGVGDVVEAVEEA